ncbi:MAG: nucleotide exchange factor GrpE, partial [Gammaproteobacteria bacterium]|nr:nucleotide exchange factor GrpE [Gammaproteobacteria bacterium]
MSTAQDSNTHDAKLAEDESASASTTGQREDVADQSQQQPDQQDQTATVSELQAQLAQALEQAEQHKEQFLRAKAEVENIQRRATSDVSNAHKYAIERFATEMLSVKDSLELARAVELKGDNKTAVKNMLEGLELTLKQMDSVFEKFSLEVIDPVAGEKFDPDKHQAMTMQESQEVEPNHILLVVQK